MRQRSLPTRQWTRPMVAGRWLAGGTSTVPGWQAAREAGIEPAREHGRQWVTLADNAVIKHDWSENDANSGDRSPRHSVADLLYRHNDAPPAS